LIGFIKYLTSLTYMRPDGLPAVILSLYADWKVGEVKLSKDLAGFAWVSLDETRNYDLVDGMWRSRRY